METLINSVRTAIRDGNFHAALFVALTLPDICKKLENPADNNSFARYKAWFEKYMTQYDGYLSGDDCYALRCAILHEGSASITSQRVRQTLEYVIFIEDGAHMNLFKDCIFNGLKKTFLQLSAKKFSEDICKGVEVWLSDVSGNTDIQKRMQEGIEIHPKGFIHYGIKFV